MPVCQSAHIVNSLNQDLLARRYPGAAPDSGPPSMTAAAAPDAERSVQRRAAQPGGRCAGVRSQACRPARRACRTSSTSSARSASPRCLCPGDEKVLWCCDVAFGSLPPPAPEAHAAQCPGACLYIVIYGALEAMLVGTRCERRCLSQRVGEAAAPAALAATLPGTVKAACFKP